MKTRNYLLLVVVAIVATLNFSFFSTKQVSKDLLTLASVENIAHGENIGGGVVVTCSSGRSGHCFKMTYQEGLFGTCYFNCTYTGYQDDYCSQMYVDVVNFCTMIGGI